MKLFKDEEKVKQIDSSIAEKMGFDKVYNISGQTYTRKQDRKSTKRIIKHSTKCIKICK